MVGDITRKLRKYSNAHEILQCEATDSPKPEVDVGFIIIRAHPEITQCRNFSSVAMVRFNGRNYPGDRLNE